MLRPLKHVKLSSLFCKFISSTTLLGNPSSEYAKHNIVQLNPLKFLLNPANLRGLTLPETLIAHNILLKTRLIHCNIISVNNLIASYGEFGCMDYAFKLFDQIHKPNLVTWNLMIVGCKKNSNFNDSWRFFCQMHRVGISMDEFTYASVLSACAALNDVIRGEQVYGSVVKRGFLSSGYVRSGMIDLFVRCSRIDDAIAVLYDVHCDNVVCWNSVVSGAVSQNEYYVALEIFRQMYLQRTLMPNASTFSSALTACAAVKNFELGKSIHGWVIKSGSDRDTYVSTATVDFYGKCGAMSDAINQFKLMEVRNIVSWTAIISGFVRKGNLAIAISTFDKMRKAGEHLNNYLVSTVLTACANPDMLTEAMQIHCWALKIGFYTDLAVKASLISMYSKSGAINLSEIAFQESQELNQDTIWNHMISAYVQSSNFEKAIDLFHQMQKQGISPNQYSSTSMLSIVDDLVLGRQLHLYFLKTGLLCYISIGSSIVTMYSKCGNLLDSMKAFEQLEVKDCIARTSMISGFAEHGEAEKAIHIFKNMLLEKSVDESSLTAILTACSSRQYIHLGQALHCLSVRIGLNIQERVNGTLVHMYSKCSDLNSVRKLFNMMPIKHQASLTSIVSGFTQNGLVFEALEFFKETLLFGMSISDFTISSILHALVESNRSDVCTQLHTLIVKSGLELESSVGSSLIMMYSKCGSIEDCSKIFQKIRNPDLILWTTMIASYAQHGQGLEALRAYELMKKSGIGPDAVTFVGVLSACSQTGLVEDGYFHLNSMIREYKIEPGYKHYACMVDLLGRAGRLEEALRFIFERGIKHDILMWKTLLASCRMHSNHEIGGIALEKIMELKGSDAGAYVSMSNILADSGEWDRVGKVRNEMGESRVEKEPGWSEILCEM